MIYRIFAVLILLMLSACVTPPLQGRVTRFHVLDAGTKTFSVTPSGEQQDSLEFRAYATLVRDQLKARGWQEVPLNIAEIAVFLQYQISNGRQVVFSYPVFGQVPTGNSYTTGTVNTFGNTATINTTTTKQTTFGVVGSGTGTQIAFDRAVKVTMISATNFRATNKMERLYEGEIRSTGSVGDLPTVMPALIKGLFQEFPGNSGSTRNVQIPMQ